MTDSRYFVLTRHEYGHGFHGKGQTWLLIRGSVVVDDFASVEEAREAGDRLALSEQIASLL